MLGNDLVDFVHHHRIESRHLTQTDFGRVQYNAPFKPLIITVKLAQCNDEHVHIFQFPLVHFITIIVVASR